MKISETKPDAYNNTEVSFSTRKYWDRAGQNNSFIFNKHIYLLLAYQKRKTHIRLGVGLGKQTNKQTTNTVYIKSKTPKFFLRLLHIRFHVC